MAYGSANSTIGVTSGHAAHHRPHLTQTDLAQRWLLSPRTLEKWRQLRIGPAYVKIGGRVRYLLADIESFELARRWWRG
jgi:hypothetical protein